MAFDPKDVRNIAAALTLGGLAVGQCCKYSEEWVTRAIVIDMAEEKVEKLVALQDAKSLNYIEVIPFELDDPDIAYPMINK